MKRFDQLLKWIALPLLLLIFFSCNKKQDDSPVTEKNFNLSGFNRISAGEKFNLVITKGNEFSIKAKGPLNSVNDITMNVVNNILDIEYNHYENQRPQIDIIITLPLLTALNLSGGSSGTVNGFQNTQNV